MLKDLQQPQKNIFIFIVVTFFFIVFLLLFSMTMQKKLDHDEHQFIASGELLANKLLVPYKDYPHNHMPYLVFVYASIFKFTDHILLGARIFNVVCAWLSLILIFYISFNFFRRHHYLISFLISAGSVIFLMTNPLFVYTSGISWNHDLPILFTLLAFVFHCHGATLGKARKWLFFSGILLGLAIGTRLSFATAIVPSFIMIVLYPNTTMSESKLNLFLLFSLGVFLALLPALVMFVLTPEQFIFGNIEYAKLNTLYRQESGYHQAMTIISKLKYLTIKVVCKLGNLKIFFPYIFFFFSANIIKHCVKTDNYFEDIFLLFLILFLLVGSFAPTPSWYQYFYAPIPFLVLGILFRAAYFYNQYKSTSPGLKLFSHIIIIFMIIVSIGGLSYYRHIYYLLSPNEWFTNKVHKIGVEIKTAVEKGKVLTFAPIFPLEGGAEIYEEFVNGPFEWRTASLLPKNKRKELGVISEDDLNDFLRKQPPGAILVGFEEDLEKSLVTYAKENGYKASELSNGKTLWLSPY